MRKKIGILIVVSVLMVTVIACGKKVTNVEPEVINGEDITQEDVTEPEVGVLPDDMYRSELTNEPISKDLMNQRPIAVMVDNEITALPHFGVANADIVYELMNSLENGRVTRLMVVQKDWQNIEQLGSIRSSRSTNFYLMWEYNAIFCHDGGPFYVLPFYDLPYTDHLNGIFSRIANGKSREFTEYVTSKDLMTGLANSGISIEYNQYYKGAHFIFANELNPVNFDGDADVIAATSIKLPFEHNGSYLSYNEERGLYEYGEYGKLHVDELSEGVPTAFKNVIIQCCTFAELDENGYMVYNVIDKGLAGYYITNGKANPITWEKKSDTEPTRYFDAKTGEEIMLNTGKTYIAIVPDDVWGDLVIN